MALTSVRIQFARQTGSYPANSIAYFSPAVAKALVAAGHTALDAIPAGTAAPVTGASLKHAARVAREVEIITSEADRQLIAHEAAPLE